MTSAVLTESRFRILVVEDQALMRALLERWLTEQPRFVLVGSARSGEEALSIIETARPDIAMVDYQLPGMDGLEFVRAARQQRPQLRALIISSLLDPLTCSRVQESGVEGYLEKDAPPESLAEALSAIANGRSYYSSTFRDVLVREGSKALAVGKVLSRREQQVLAHVLTRKTNKEIADLIGLSTRTVEFHRANLMAKLDATNIAELLDHAQMRGWKT
jgi:DNA-binding NarL/FixJ family response regulator